MRAHGSAPCTRGKHDCTAVLGLGLLVDEDGLADAFRTGSAEGVRAVYERYSGAVFTIALRILGDRELAADAVQVTFLNAWRAW